MTNYDWTNPTPEMTAALSLVSPQDHGGDSNEEAAGFILDAPNSDWLTRVKEWSTAPPVEKDTMKWATGCLVLADLMHYHANVGWCNFKAAGYETVQEQQLAIMSMMALGNTLNRYMETITMKIEVAHMCIAILKALNILLGQNWPQLYKQLEDSRQETTKSNGRRE